MTRERTPFCGREREQATNLLDRSRHCGGNGADRALDAGLEAVQNSLAGFDEPRPSTRKEPSDFALDAGNRGVDAVDSARRCGLDAAPD